MSKRMRSSKSEDVPVAGQALVAALLAASLLVFVGETRLLVSSLLETAASEAGGKSHAA